MSLLRIYTHADCLGHDTGPSHVETPARLVALLAALRAAFPDADWQDAPRALREDLLRVHAPELVDHLLGHAPASPREWLDEDTAFSPGSSEALLRAAGAGIGAVDWVLEGQQNRAFCAVRPPGHHAERDASMGFCLVNNIAIAAAHALSGKLVRRLAIVDFDAHHGNGTEAIFRHDPRVLYVSSHQLHLYPTAGGEDCEEGHLLNCPLPAGVSREVFLQHWQTRLLPEIERFAPDLLLVSAGFDAHAADPLSALPLTSEDYFDLGKALVAIADRHAQGRVVSMLEGGYDPVALAESAIAHLRALAA